MRWFRDNVRHGSWLALVAIAINLALSFGHVHATADRGSEGRIAAVLGATDHGNAPGHSDDPQTDLCPICIASSAIANAVGAAPPAMMPLQLAAFVVERPLLPVRLAVALPRAPFQWRGPPLS